MEPLTTSISVYLFKEWPPKVVMAFSGWFKCRSWSKVKPNQRRERHLYNEEFRLQKTLSPFPDEKHAVKQKFCFWFCFLHSLLAIKLHNQIKVLVGIWVC